MIIHVKNLCSVASLTGSAPSKRSMRERRFRVRPPLLGLRLVAPPRLIVAALIVPPPQSARPVRHNRCPASQPRSEEHTSELQSLMRISYAVFCLKKKKKNTKQPIQCAK